ncbi:hypothetical protein [Stakelama pacifica]|uniref:Uncharacterized protein n=1 Tax=Stakelama pacifica TaxID=517720 RepID=A0A4R6FSB7_9SPHN|nr:hypothetical protein [Stakelama pacifica]TDN84651.1 hypothetical protein EV664_103298 [Stakelama pacifica]GGO93176.1 hypothetical protein GCM10011329_11980 [Stakelama pacifica]
MWQWISAHSAAISIFFNFLMVVVWVTYLQLLLVQFRATRRSSILITRAAGRGMRSRCLVTNMSSQPLYVTSLIGTLHVGDRQIELPLTDLRDLPDDLGNDPRSKMGQGSLNTGQYLDIGHFHEIVEVMLAANDENEVAATQVDQFDLTVVAFYSREDLPVGATRSFHFDHAAAKGSRVKPLSLSTDQIRQLRRRRALLKQVEYHM